jgi:hypothetical protein
MLPSVYDTDGLVKREAASCGCPSLLIAGSNAAEGIEEGVNGFTCALDAGAYAAALGGIIANPGLARAAGEEARRTVYISWEQVIDRVAVEYERIIDEYAEKKAAGTLKRRHYSIPVAIAQEILNKQAVRIRFATRSADRRVKEHRALAQKKNTQNIKKLKDLRTRMTEGIRKRGL